MHAEALHGLARERPAVGAASRGNSQPWEQPTQPTAGAAGPSQPTAGAAGPSQPAQGINPQSPRSPGRTRPAS